MLVNEDWYGYSGRRYLKNEKTAPLRLNRMGGAADWCGLPPEMYRLRTSDHDSEGEGGEECEGNHTGNYTRNHTRIKKFLHISLNCAIMNTRDILMIGVKPYILAPFFK